MSAEHLESLLAQLDLEAKVRLLTGATKFTLAGDDRVGLGEMAFSDGPAGVRGLALTGGNAAALLPNATLLAASWSEHTAYECGRIIAEEAERQHIHVVLGPTVNLHRSPLGGRLFEAYSEDPLLTGRIAAAYVRGVQQARVGACLKHLVANEAETERTSVDNRVDVKTLRELYLLPFEIAVAEAEPWTLMAAYNDVNGTPATEHEEILAGIVRGEWGYTGLVMSDWYATKSTTPSANAGLDLVMPGPTGPWGPELVTAVRAGEVSEPVVDEHVCRLLRLAERVGALGTPRDWPAEPVAPDAPVRKEALRRLAASGMTVLTNNGVLPLARESSVAVVGRHALETVTMGAGSAEVTPPYAVSVAEGLRALLGERVTAVDGVEVRDRPLPARAPHVVDPVTNTPGVRVVLRDAEGVVLDEQVVGEGKLLLEPGTAPAARVTTVTFRARVDIDGPAHIGVLGVGQWSLVAGGRPFETSLTSSGTDPADTAFNPPSWIEPEPVVLSPGGLIEATATLGLHQGDVDEPVAGLMLGLVAQPMPRDPDVALADAAAAAAGADVAVVVVGLTEEQETEAADKTTLALPGRQDDLVRAVAAAASRTVVVVNAATPVLMPWRDEVDAILWAGLPGQEGGHAVAAALVGDLEPAGRLVTSFPAADGASPAWSVTPVGGRLSYDEGTFIGYRGYAAGRAPAPAFWFGHGLGYGSWDYSHAAVERRADDLVVDVDVTNTGARRSREVVHVYLEPSDPAEPTRLVGWRAAEVEPCATARVRVTCDQRMWRSWDPAEGHWAHLAAGGALLVARGLGDVRRRIALDTMPM